MVGYLKRPEGRVLNLRKLKGLSYGQTVNRCQMNIHTLLRLQMYDLIDDFYGLIYDVQDRQVQLHYVMNDDLSYHYVS